MEYARCRLTGTQWTLIENMEVRVRELCRAAGRVSVAGGRVTLLEEILATREDDVDYGALVTTALEVESDKISLPPRAGVVPIASLSPEVASQCLEVARSFRAAEDCWPEKRGVSGWPV